MIELALKAALERLTGLDVYPLLLPDELQEGNLRLAFSSFFCFLRSPCTIGTTVAWMCGVSSSMCSTADTRFSAP